MTKQTSQNGPARVGIGGPVGSGKTALIEQLIPFFINRGNEIAIVTNDLVTREDAKRLQQSGLLAPERVVAVEAGACPHTVIREDPTLNIQAANRLDQEFENLDIILIESGGDNLASTFSLDLVDYWMFVIDTSEGDDIPRKRGPGIVQSDLLVINKIDIAKYVGADVDLMVKEGKEVRNNKPLVLTNCKTGQGIEDVANHIIDNVLFK
jgi:urease accessory protein